jgi:hypothetical protein
MGTTQANPLVIKLAAIMSEVGRIEKRGRNEFHKYDYAMEADIVEALRAKLAERNVMILPECIATQRNENLTTAAMRFTVIDGDSGSEVTLNWTGTGEDKGDKGLYKAFTGALKYFLLKLFLLPTGDDPEADESSDKSRAAKPEIKAPRKKAADAKPQPADAPAATKQPEPVAVPAAPGELTVTSAEPRSLAGGKTIYDVTTSDNVKYVTFSKTLFEQARGLTGKPLASVDADPANRFGDRKLNALIPAAATQELTEDDIPF